MNINYSNDFTNEIKKFPIPFEVKLRVKNQSYDNIVGTPTIGGGYRDGCTFKVVQDKWLVITGYTSCDSRVCIDFTFTFKIKDGRYLLRRVSGLKHSWVSTPTWDRYNDPLMYRFLNGSTPQERWKGSIKYCRNFFKEAQVFL